MREMRFGVREIANVTFRPLTPMDIGNQHFSAYQPCLYIDTAKASNMEVATTSVYAMGGRGNARLIAWEGEKTATFTITDALLSPVSFAMLSGAGVLEAEAGEKIVHLTVDGIVTADGIKIKAEDVKGYAVIEDTAQAAELRPYAMVLDRDGAIIDYLGANELADKITVSGTEWVIAPNGENKKFTNKDILDKICRVDLYAVTTDASVKTLVVDAEKFGGTFYIEAETLFRDEATGQDFPATFIIPKGKIQGNFTFNMAAEGDPSTFDFTIDCTLGKIRTIKSAKKQLYAIDIIDTISEENHIEKAANDAPGNSESWTAFKAKATE